MLELDFSQSGLTTQKNVVIEEYNQRYINQPYGDAILKLRPAAYKVHPYRWPAIGRDIIHVANTNLDQIKDFFFTHYAPNNAIIALTGNINYDHAYNLTLKWFGPIEKRKLRERNLPAEPEQTEERTLIYEKNVPANAIYKAWHTGPRISHDFYTLDLITDLLAGETGRLNVKLVREKKLFSEINAYLTSDIDPGLLIIQGKLMDSIDIQEADRAIQEVINSLSEVFELNEEMEMAKNKFESSTVFSNTSILNKAMNLAYFELLGDAGLINLQSENYRNVSREMVMESAVKTFSSSNCTTLFYKSKRNVNE
jgi:zinc protease